MVRQAYLWLAIPVLIWFFGWLRLWIALPAACCVIAVIVRIRMHTPAVKGLKSVRVDRRYLAGMGILALFVLLSGIGGYMYQSYSDHSYRNAVFNTLVANSWPVDEGTGSHSILCYYFGFWLPAALTAKLAGIEAGWLVQALYALWALVIVFNFVYARFGGKAIIALPLIFVFFCGWEVPGWIICHLAQGDTITLSELIRSQKDLMGELYAGNAPYADFFYIYNQSCTALVGCALLYFTRDDAGASVFAWSLMFIGCVFPCIALAPVMLRQTIRKWRQMITWSNAAGLLVFAIVGVFYLASPRAMKETDLFPDGSAAHYLTLAIFYLILIAGIYIPFIFKAIRYDATFWILFATMVLAPFASFAGTADMGWRMGIPFIFYLCYKLMGQFIDYRQSRQTLKTALLCFVLAVGALSPAFHYADVVRQTIRVHSDPAGFPPGGLSLRRDDRNANFHNPECTPCYSNFFADGDNLFTRYLMKQ